ncbi:MAG: tRNA (adenosine(37)-N6)-threonylcarbamoyltransferase complex ATPase subunit type 1 TsaE [Acidimicrobiales bacterium]|nr:MAG: tRNA (adenosine(37)-N6)-threonylcarbamoyltransferase complex ATPase subunit type 1 TsaE [Acidimicrobiales bacterium]
MDGRSTEGAIVDVETRSPDETELVAGEVASLCREGDVLLLVGPLGAGKTVFVRGFAKAKGVQSRVTSPTFTIAQRYRGDVDIHHLDLYRLERLSELEDAALEDLVGGDGIVLVEWGDLAAGALGPEVLEVRIRLGDEPTSRRIFFAARGTSWADRVVELGRILRARSQRWRRPTLGHADDVA